MTEVPELIFYAIETDTPLKFIPAGHKRQWMDDTPSHYAYRCTPLSIANSSGWVMESPIAFDMIWKGGTANEDIQFFERGSENVLNKIAISHFGSGIVTFHIPYLIRTSPGYALWVRGMPNYAKDGIAPLDGLVETDKVSHPFSFTMNWRFIKKDFPVHFDVGDPLCFITPFKYDVIDDIQPKIIPLENNIKLKEAFMEWSSKRDEFNKELKEQKPETVKKGWQKMYINNISNPKRKLRFPK